MDFSERHHQSPHCIGYHSTKKTTNIRIKHWNGCKTCYGNAPIILKKCTQYKIVSKFKITHRGLFVSPLFYCQNYGIALLHRGRNQPRVPTSLFVLNQTSHCKFPYKYTFIWEKKHIFAIDIGGKNLPFSWNSAPSTVQT